VYLLVIFLLYSFRWRPSRAEPVLNILDLGFIAVLVEYTGGFSIFLALFAGSLLLSAADFTFQERADEFKDAPLRRRLSILVLPYCIAFVLSIFWSVSDGVLLNGASVGSYLLDWVTLLSAAVVVWYFCYRVVSHITRSTRFAPS
jgi:hypothetical protein